MNAKAPTRAKHHALDRSARNCEGYVVFGIVVGLSTDWWKSCSVCGTGYCVSAI